MEEYRVWAPSLRDLSEMPVIQDIGVASEGGALRQAASAERLVGRAGWATRSLKRVPLSLCHAGAV